MDLMDDTIKNIIYSGEEDAFFVCDLGRIIQQHELWQSNLGRVKTYYAVKCNDNEIVLQTIAKLGVNFDCSSKGEIDKVLSMNVGPDRILYSNTIKRKSHLRHAKAKGITSMTFDNECELNKIKDLMPEAKLLIRIRCDDPNAVFKLGKKFGCDAKEEAPRLLVLAKTLNLNVVGVHFHIGSGFRDPEYFPLGISMARDLFDLATSMGFNFNVLDIGGGFTGHKKHEFIKIANIINTALELYFPGDSVEIIAEPGRFYVEKSFTLLCNITCVRSIEVLDEETNQMKTHNMYYIDEGVYGNFILVIFDEPVYPIVFKQSPNSELMSSSLWGPTCDSSDCVVKECSLPKMEVGDWIKFENMGAYTLVFACHFNGLDKTNIYYTPVEQKCVFDARHPFNGCPEITKEKVTSTKQVDQILQ